MQTENNIVNRREQREIDLIDLMWEIIYSWRGILILILVGAVLLCGVQYAKSSVAYKHQALEDDVNGTAVEITADELAEALSEDEISEVKSAADNKLTLDRMKKYIDESIYMHIDPYNEDRVTLLYNVSERGDAIRSAYTTFLANGNMAQEVSEKLGDTIDSIYLKELIGASNVSGVESSVSIDMEVESTRTVDRQFTVTILGESASQAEEIADAVKEQIEKYTATVAEKLGAHTLVLVDSYSVQCKDNTMLSYQTTQKNDYDTARTKLNTKLEDFTDDQMAYYKALVIDEDETDGAADESSDTENQGAIIETPRPSVKYLLIGAVAGAFCAFMWIALRYMMTGKVNNVEELQELYALPILGTLSQEQAKSGFLPGVDRWLDKLRFGEQMTKEEQTDLTVSNICMSLRRDKVTNVFITSSCHLTETDRACIDDLSKRILEQGIASEYGENITRNTSAFEMMAQTKHVILVEKSRVSSYTTIEKELILCREQEAEVLGVVGI